MEENYTYTKERRTFGKQCIFTDRNEILFSEPMHREYARNYILRDPVDRGTQLSKQMAADWVNTENKEYFHRGINHIEGGWPKDVNPADEEATLRYRKRIEREDQWNPQMMSNCTPMIHYLLQNNASNIYEDYFVELDQMQLFYDFDATTVQTYNDAYADPRRQISQISYSPDDLNFCAAYANYPYQSEQANATQSCLMWDIENAIKPIRVFTSETVTTKVQYNIRDQYMIITGLHNGKVCVYDIRDKENNPVAKTEREQSHRERVTDILWIHSKANSEFFSGSTDGQTLWWDYRKLTQPTDSLLADPAKTDDQVLSRSYGVTVLEFEYTIPTRFMLGTDQGVVFIGNKKAKLPTEKILAKLNCFTGPIYVLQRNPIFVKNFLTIGDWCATIWTEECKDNPIIWTKNFKTRLTCGCWSKGKCTLFILGHIDGSLDFWDLLYDHKKPALQQKVCVTPITYVTTSEDGRHVAVGNAHGNVYVIRLSENLTFSDRNDRANLTAMFERETKREKIMEGRLRELRLKYKPKEEEPNVAESTSTATAAPSEAPTAGTAGTAGATSAAAGSTAADDYGSEEEAVEVERELDEMELCEKNFFDTIEKEKRRRELIPIIYVPTEFDKVEDEERARRLAMLEEEEEEEGSFIGSQTSNLNKD